MAIPFPLEASIALVPVLMFLGVLVMFDSYRLISLRELILTISSGLALGIAAYYANDYLIQRAGIDYAVYSRFAGPVVEESIKASAIVLLLLFNRIGFMIDAAIMGFAVGTGFAVFENVYFLSAFRETDLGLWILRGFGTALMHGGATALFAALTQSIVDRRAWLGPLALIPGLLVAAALHIAYNLLVGTPQFAMLGVLVVLPILFYLIFSKSEHAVHQWLVHDYASHQQLLDDIESGRFAHSEAGRFIIRLARRFGEAVVADIFEYLKLHTKIVLRAEQLSLARERKEKLPLGPQDKEDLHRLRTLERKIGRIALMTLWPHLHFSRRELWEIHEFHDEAGVLG
jgi:RsiW-degrading membrane proteinase PrsW (M82 family)